MRASLTFRLGPPNGRPPLRGATLFALFTLVAPQLTGCHGCGRSSASTDGGTPAEIAAGKLAADLALAEGDDTQQAPTTAAESRERRPAWADKGTYGPSLDPRLAEGVVSDLKRSGTSLPATGLLACTVTVTGQVRAGLSGLMGIGSTPTLGVELDLGKEKVRFEAPLPSQDFSFSVPLVTLEPTSQLVLTIDSMANGSVKKTIRIPIAATARGIVEGSREDNTAFCAVLPQVEVEKRLKSELVVSTKALANAALDAHLVQEEKRGFGRTELEATVVAKTSVLAAHAGWADPRVLRRKEWGERMLAHHGKRILEMLAARKPEDTLLGFGKFASEQVSSPCSKEALATAFAFTSEVHRPTTGCAFRANLTRDADSQDLQSDTFFHHLAPNVEADIVLADGDVVVSTVSALEGKVKSTPDVMSKVTLAKSDPGALHFHVRSSLLGKAAPHTLVLRNEQKWIAIPYHDATKAAPSPAPSTR